jgi:hypothetical protein
MVNTSGLQRRSTYEEVMREIQLDSFKDHVKLPDRIATFTLEAPQLMALDPENEEAVIQFEKRKRAEVARKAQVEEVAQARGVSVHQLEMATRPSRGDMLEAPDDELDRRRHELGIHQAAEIFAAAHVRAQNVERVRDTLRMSLHAQDKSDPIARLSPDDHTIFYDMSTPEEQDIDLHLPAVPERRVALPGMPARDTGILTGAAGFAGGFAGGLGGTALDIGRAAGPPTAQALAQALSLTVHYGPGAIVGTAQVAAGTVGLVARGLASGGQMAGRAALAASHVLASTTPASHRGKDFRESAGVRLGRNTLTLGREALG